MDPTTVAVVAILVAAGSEVIDFYPSRKTLGCN